MSAHTPGPWEAVAGDEEPRLQNAKGERVYFPHVIVGPVREGYSPSITINEAGGQNYRPKRGESRLEEFDANARLIAAAPDLLAALYGVVSAPGYADLPEVDRERVRAAIAKAEGKP